MEIVNGEIYINDNELYLLLNAVGINDKDIWGNYERARYVDEDTRH